MNDSRFEIMPSVVVELIMQIAKQMHAHDLIFTDPRFCVPIANFKEVVGTSRVRKLGIYDPVKRKKVGILNFEKNHCFKLKAPRKIIWKIKLEHFDQEEKAKKIVDLTRTLHPSISFQILVEGNK